MVNYLSVLKLYKRSLLIIFSTPGNGKTEKLLNLNGFNRFTSFLNMNKHKPMAVNEGGDILKM